MPRFLVLCFAMLSACAPEGPTYWADAKPILDAHCASCHTGGGPAPFALDAFEPAAAVAPLVASAVEARTMPPWGAEEGAYPLRYDPSLTDAQIEVLTAWADSGAAQGDPASEGEPVPLEHGGIGRVDLELSLPEPYLPDGQYEDDYRCFPIDWPLDEPAFVTGYTGLPDNLSVTHHMVGFLVPEAYAEQVRGFDAHSEGPGYPCFGSIAPVDQASDPVQQTILGQWAPGNAGVAMAGGAGIAVQPGSVFVLQMHYTTLVDGLAPDQSSYGIRIARPGEVTREGWIVPWLDFRWIANPELMTIPPDEVTHHGFESVIPQSVQALSSGAIDLEGAVDVLSILPHMHKLGRTIELSIVRADGSTEPVLNVPEYDFDWQQEYVFEEPLRLEAEDQLRVDCWWDNSLEYRRERGVLPLAPTEARWGEGTYDEMCIAMVALTGAE